MKRILIFLLVIIPFLSFGQTQGREYIDSLQGEASAARQDTTRAKIFASLSNVYWAFAPDSGILYGTQALTLAERWGNKKVKAYAYRAIASNHRYNGDYEKAERYNDSALKLYTVIGDKDGIAGVYTNISILKIDKSDYPGALDDAFKGLKIYDELGNKNRVSSSYTNISIIYTDMGNYSKAVEYLQRALKIDEERGNKRSTEITLSNLGRTYMLMGEDSLALVYDFKALKLSEEIGGKNSSLQVLGYIAASYYNLKNFHQSIVYFSKALEIAQELKNKKAIAEQMGNLGEIYLAIALDSIRVTNTGNFALPSKKEALQKAISYSLEAAGIREELHNIRDLSYNYANLYTAWELAGEKGKALDAYKKYIEYRDSVFSKENKNKIANLEKQRELDSIKQQVKIDQLKIAKQNLEAMNKRNERFYLFMGMGLLILVIVFITLERKKSERLLLNILPPKIAARLKQKEHPIADHFVAASIIFIDMADFTILSKNTHPKEMVNILNDIFTKFDALAEKYGLEKIKTIGDCYMAVAGLPEPRQDHAKAAALMALNIRALMHEYNAPNGSPIRFRIGLDCGPVVAGVIGRKKFIYDLWGDAVNTASRMESTGIAGEIQCTDNFREELIKEHAEKFQFVSRGMIEIKGKGVMQTWLINNGAGSA